MTKKFISLLNSFLRKIPGVLFLKKYLKHRHQGYVGEFPPGHYYSPLPDLDIVQKNSDQIFQKDVYFGDDLAINEQSQISLLNELMSYRKDFCFPIESDQKFRYYSNNMVFGIGSAFSLYGMFRHFNPSHVIEIGSGYSSALMLDIGDLFLQSQVSYTFIEPNPQRLYSLIRAEDYKRCEILPIPVQEVSSKIFKILGPNDIFFVDSSHISKIGSDVNYILFSVLPVLQDGVIIHFHDIYWPFEYPETWIMNGRFWNEAYILRAFLQYNQRFEILQFNNYLAYRHSDYYRQNMPEVLQDPGSSLWIIKK